MFVAVGEKAYPLSATTVSTGKPSRAPQNSYCRTLGACQETDTDMKNRGAEHLLQGLDGHAEAGIGSTRHREHLDTQVSLYNAGLTSLA